MQGGARPWRPRCGQRPRRGGSRDLLLRVTMTSAKKGARSRRECRGCPERPGHRFQTGGSDARRKAGIRQRRARARARNPTCSAVKASVPIAGLRKTPRRKPDWLVRLAHIERGHGLPVVRNERKAGICSGLSFDEASARRSQARSRASCVSVYGGPIGVRRKHPSATGAPHAPREGAREMEGRVGRKELGMRGG